MADANFFLGVDAKVTGGAAFNGMLSDMEKQIQREKASLEGLEEKLGSARKKLDFIQGGGSSGKKVDLFQLDRQKDLIASLEKKIGARQSNIGKLGGAKEEIDKTSKAADKLIGKRGAIKDVLGGELGNLASSASAAGGPIGGLSDKLQTFANIAGKGGAAGAAFVLVAAIFAVVAAAVVGALALAHFALEAADAARSMRLLGDAAGGSTAEGSDLAMVVNDIATRVPLAKAKIAELGRAMEIAHVSGRRMQTALEAVATLESLGLGGSKISELAQEWSKLGARAVLTRTQLEGTGLTIDEVSTALADRMGGSVAAAKKALASGTVAVNVALDAINAATQRKFGKTLAAQTASLTTQFAKMKENLSGLFEGIDISEFLAGLKTITDLFSQNNIVGYSLKKILTGVFTDVFNALAVAIPYVRAFLLGMAIGALVAYIAIMKIKNAIVAAFGGASIDKAKTLEYAMWAGVGAIGAMIAIAVVLTVVVGGLIAAFVALGLVLALPFLIALGAIALFVYSLYRIYSVINSIDLGPAASNLVKSFTDKIRSSIGSVIDAMSALGIAAADALNDALGIASPSKVAIEAGQNVTTTFANTVEDGNGDTRAAFDGMVNAGAKGGAAAPGRASPSVEFNNCSFGEGTTREKVMEWVNFALEAWAGEGPTPEGAT